MYFKYISLPYNNGHTHRVLGWESINCNRPSSQRKSFNPIIICVIDNSLFESKYNNSIMLILKYEVIIIKLLILILVYVV